LILRHCAFCSAGSTSDVQFGWTIGGGLEHVFARGWSLKAEYLYFDLGDVTYTGRATAGFVAGLPTLIPE
jgi:outer membrane immunogenic protein